MKKIILTTLISFGLALAANAQKRGHSNGHNDHNSRSGNSSYQKGHSSHNSKSHKGHGSHYGNSHRGHNSYYGNSHRGHSSYSYTTQRVWVPPRYEYVRRPCGTLVRVCVSHGYYNTVQTGGYYTYKRVPVSHGHGHHRSGLSISWRF